MRSKRNDRIARICFWIIGMTSVAILLFIIIEILARGLTTALNPKFIFGRPEAVKSGGGIFPMIVSTFYLVALTLIIALPLSLGAAIYMSEFARRGRLSNAIRFSLDSLATLPSIVFGLFGMTLFVIYLKWGYCLIAGAFTLALLNLPILLRGTEEALKQVPTAYREGSLSLGASRWTTIRQVVIPSALPGVLSATILPIGRIMGESAAVIYTTGLFVRSIPVNPLSTAAPMVGYIWYAQSEAMVPDYRQIVDGGAALLLIMVLIVYFLARFLARRYQVRKLPGLK